MPGVRREREAVSEPETEAEWLARVNHEMKLACTVCGHPQALHCEASVAHPSCGCLAAGPWGPECLCRAFARPADVDEESS